MKRIAIIGGGIAGLSAAFEIEKAKKRVASVAYEVFERGSRFGGTLHTERIGEFVVEAGADSFLTEKPWARELCREVGLEHELVGSNDEQRQTYVLIGGKLQPLPQGLQFIVPSGPALHSTFFSQDSRKRFVQELELKPRASESDESVAAFVERHFGREVLERVADPMLAGIYGGEAERLSARAVLSRFVEMEQTHGSLIRAMQDAPRKRLASSPLFTSLKAGLGQLVAALLNRLDPKSLHLNHRVEALDWREKKWFLSLKGAQEFDAVVLALPACSSAILLKSSAPELSRCLAKIRCTSSMTVALGFAAERARFGKLPDGFGFLVPRAEKRRLLACTLVHNKCSHRVPTGAYLVRLFFGGARDEGALTLSDEEAIALAQQQLREITGFAAAPDLARVWRWKDSMAQYDVGHLELIKEIEQLTARTPGLALAGNGYRGVGIPDCIPSGREAARKLLKWVGAEEGI